MCSNKEGGVFHMLWHVFATLAEIERVRRQSLYQWLSESGDRTEVQGKMLEMLEIEMLDKKAWKEISVHWKCWTPLIWKGKEIRPQGLGAILSTEFGIQSRRRHDLGFLTQRPVGYLVDVWELLCSQSANVALFRGSSGLKSWSHQGILFARESSSNEPSTSLQPRHTQRAEVFKTSLPELGYDSSFRKLSCLLKPSKFPRTGIHDLFSPIWFLHLVRTGGLDPFGESYISCTE